MVGYESTAGTWVTWVSNMTSSSTAFTASTYNPWLTWTASAVTYANSAAVSTATWNSWSVAPVQARYVTPVETAEQRVARELRTRQERETWAAQDKVRREARRIAISKADDLLESVLSQVQREQLQKESGFLVRGQSGVVYRVRRGRSINVDEIAGNGEVVRTHCAHPSMDVPDGDTMVAQKLMLECDEQEFLRIAYKHAARGPRVESAALAQLLAHA